MASWDEEIQNSWTRSSLSIPGISFAEHRIGDGVKQGILLPTPSGKFSGFGFHEVPVMEPDKIQVIKNGRIVMEDNPNFGKPKRWNDGRIMQQTVLTMLTPLKTLDYDGMVSEKSIERIKTARSGGDDAEVGFLNLVEEYGLRRLFVQGKSMDQGFRAAVKAVSKMPEVGGMVTVLLEALEPNDKGGKTKIYTVKYEKPTAASMAAVEKYLRDAASAVNAFLHVDDEDKPKKASEPEPEHVPDDGGDPPF